MGGWGGRGVGGYKAGNRGDPLFRALASMRDEESGGLRSNAAVSPDELQASSEDRTG